MEENILCLFAGCIPVKGFKRSIICDLQRGKFFLIPNALYQVLTDHCGKTVKDIKSTFNGEYDVQIDQYVNFLFENDLCFYTSHPEKFPKIELSWDSSSEISNALIDINESSSHPFDSIFTQLDSLNCYSVQLRFFSSVSITFLRSVLELSKYGRLRAIYLLIPFSELISQDELESVCNEYKRVKQVVIHSSTENSLNKSLSLKTNIAYIKEVIDSASHCGVIHPVHFRTNIQLFTESQHFNNCLNRKLSIDVFGNIKNCPALPESFGNIKETSMISAINNDNFKTLWSINKDSTLICRDCEFRYICTDCRAYLMDPDLINSKPLKCSYDPYLAKWLNENDDPRDQSFAKFHVQQINYLV